VEQPSPLEEVSLKKLNIGVNNICDALRAYRDVALAAEKLGCSRAYIYQQLGKYGMRPREVVQGK